MNDPLFYQYYDRLQANKDYRSEVDTILSVYADMLGGRPATVLDVGCGTGNHAFIFAEKGADVLGVDIDKGMIDVANEKRGDKNNPRFHYGDVNGVLWEKLPLIVSLFNVVNYIQTEAALLSFFRGIRERCGGIFVFDCWNGVAALRDLPKEKKKEIGGLQVHVVPRCYLMAQVVEVDNHVKEPRFTFTYVHRLWTPRELLWALTKVGFHYISMTKWMQPNVQAQHDDWKVMFTCH